MQANPLTIIEGPRICPKGRNKGQEQYKVQWHGLNSQGKPWAPAWLETSRIASQDVADFRRATRTNLDVEEGERCIDSSDRAHTVILDGVPLVTEADVANHLQQHANSHKNDEVKAKYERLGAMVHKAQHQVAKSSEGVDFSYQFVCQDRDYDDVRTVLHNIETRPCQSGKHETPRYVCTGCEARQLNKCCTPSIALHIFRDEGCHTICSTCAEVLAKDAGVSLDIEYYHGCKCSLTNHHLCVDCHIDAFQKRYDMKMFELPNFDNANLDRKLHTGADQEDYEGRTMARRCVVDGLCFCENNVEQFVARQCSGCNHLVKKTREKWNDVRWDVAYTDKNDHEVSSGIVGGSGSWDRIAMADEDEDEDEDE